MLLKSIHTDYDTLLFRSHLRMPILCGIQLLRYLCYTYIVTHRDNSSMQKSNSNAVFVILVHMRLCCCEYFIFNELFFLFKYVFQTCSGKTSMYKK